MVKKIVFTGAESTGKTFLARALAAHFYTLWNPEYARFYLTRLDRPYHPGDIRTIAEGQLNWETVWARQADQVLFCDTALWVPKVWSLYKYGFCDDWILKQLEVRHYDLYLLCAPDLPWKYDPLREHPEHRTEMHDIYRSELDMAGVLYRELNGDLIQRLERAIDFVKVVLR